MIETINQNVWLDKEFLDVIDPSVPCNRTLDFDGKSKRKNLVRDIIINHLDEEYHRKIVEVKDPATILLEN